MCRAILDIKIRQRVKTTTTHPELTGENIKRGHSTYLFSDLSLGPLGLVQVYFVGLGPCNWVAKRVIQDLVRQNIRVLIESKAREAIRNQLRSFDILEKIAQHNI